MNSASPSSKSLLQHPGLFAALMGRTCSAFAMQTLAVAIGWQIYNLTHSAKALGFVGLALFIPLLVLFLPAGQASDRFNRKTIVVICLTIETVLAIILAWLSFKQSLSPKIIYILLVVLGSARSFELPCQKTFLVNLVPAHDFPKATALSTSLFQSASILGPSLGGLLYDISTELTYTVCIIGFGLSALMTLSLPLRPIARIASSTSMTNLLEGLRFLFSKPDILGAISLDLFAVLLGGTTALLPIYATDILHGGPFSLGILRSSPALGALISSILLAFFPLKRHAGLWMFSAVILFGIATLFFGLSNNLIVSIIALSIVGGADVVSVVVRNTLVQLRTPDFVLGRITAVNMLFVGSSNQLGEFESGLLSSFIGPVGCVVFGGIGTIIIALIWMKLFPSLRQVDHLSNLKPD